MSGTVDTRTVEMRFDNSDFESNVKQSMSTLEKLKRALKLDGASTGLKEVEKASRKLDFRDFKGNIDGVGKRFSVLETIATGALLKIGSSAAEAGMRIAKSLTIDQVAAGWNKYAEKTTAVQTIMANLREDEGDFIDEASKMEYVNGYLEKLMWFSDETSYSFTDMTSNVGKFIANGQGLSESVTAMQGIATWAAVSGQNTQVAARAMYNISQAMGTGSMKIKDWMSIENANMATAQFKELAITIGQKQGKIKEGQVTVEGFRESLSGKDTNGWFDKDVMMEVFETYGEAANRIQEYAAAHKVTATEAIREIKKVDKDFADSLGFKAFAAAQEAKTFSDVVSATADAVSTKWMQIFENVFGNYLEAKELWTNLAEDMWEIFAAPLDTINSIMTSWNQGFTEGGPLTPLQKLYESGMMDKLESSLNYVSKGAAELAVNSDKAHYRIETLADGSKQLVKLVEETPGVYTKFAKKIYEGDKGLLSGREMLIDGFRNILQTLFLGYDAEDGTHITSVLGAIKESILEVIFGTSDLDEVIPKVARKLWDFTKRFRDFTAKLKPSAKTTEKIKNSFKGLFTLFKIGGKFIKAIAKPFKDLFGNVFKNAPKSILNLADSIGSWIQALDKYLDENKVFEKVSNKVSEGLQTLSTWVNNLSVSLTGLSVKDLGKKLRDDVFGFFENHDFKGTFESVITYFTGIFQQIKSVNGEELPEKLTPLQNFWLGLKGIFEAMKGFFSLIAPVFRGIGEFLANVFTSISNAFSKNDGIAKTEKGTSKFRSVWDALKDIFSGIGDFFVSIGPTLSKVGGWIGNFFRTLGEGIAEWAKDKSPEEIVGSLLKGGFVVSLTNLINSIAGLARGGRIGKSLAKGLDAVKGVLKAYSREINASAIAEIGLAVALFAGSMWILDQIPADHMQKIGEVLMNLAAAVSLFAIAINAFKRKKNLGESLSGSGGLLDGLKEIMTATVGSSIFANDATAKFVKITLGILLAAIAAKKIVDAIGGMGDMIVKLSEIPPSQLEKGGKVAAQILAAFGIFSLFAGFSNKATSTLFAALGAYVLVKAIGKLANLMADLGSNDAKMNNIQKVVDKFGYVFEAIKSMALWAIKIAAVLTVAELALAAFSTGKLTNTVGMSKVMKQFGKNFLRVAAALLVVTVALGLMARITKNMNPGDFDKISAFFQSLIVWFSIFQSISIGILSFGTSSISDVAVVMKQFGKNFLRVAASLAIVAIAFGAMALVSKILTPGELAVIAVIFAVFLGAVSILSLLAISNATMEKAERVVKNMKAMSGLFLLVSASLVIVAAAFAIMSSLNLDTTEMWNIAGVFGAFIGVVGLLAVLLGALSGLSVNTGAVNYKGFIGVPLAALSFLGICYGITLMAEALTSIANGANISDVEKAGTVITSLVKTIAWVIGILGAEGGLVVLTGAVNEIPALGMVTAAITFGMICDSLITIAEALTTVANGADISDVEKAGAVIESLITTIAWVIGLLGAEGGLVVITGFVNEVPALGMVAAADSFATICDSLIPMAEALTDVAYSADVGNIEKAGEVIESMTSTTGWITALVGAVGGIVGEKSEKGANAFKSVSEGVKSIAEAVAELSTIDYDNFSPEVIDDLKNVIDTTTGIFAISVGDAFVSSSTMTEKAKAFNSVIGSVKDIMQTLSAISEAGNLSDVTGVVTNLESVITAAMKVFEVGFWDNFKPDDYLAKANAFAIVAGPIADMLNTISGLSDLGGLEGLDEEAGEKLGGTIKSFIDAIVGNYVSGLDAGKQEVSDAAFALTTNVQDPIASIITDASQWGVDLAYNFASGISAGGEYVSLASTYIANIVHSILGFSEPDKGPLSDFHTYAPDMIKLWNKGIYDNVGSVKESAISVADTVYDGFSTALDYVSDLIDNGMSDQLTIRPVMDLTEIQNGMNSMSSMLSSNSGYTITGTTKLAGTAAYGMRTVNATPTEAQTMHTDIGPTSNNFYITNSDPNAVADKVSKILNNQTRRQKAVWAYR